MSASPSLITIGGLILITLWSGPSVDNSTPSILAQVGNWLSWHDQTWTVKSGDKERTMTATDLLTRTVFYKVGHHGSHNATLREKGLELMTSPNLHAMIPVEVEMAQKKGWLEMPLDVLVARLKEKTKGHVAQADDP